MAHKQTSCKKSKAPAVSKERVYRFTKSQLANVISVVIRTKIEKIFASLTQDVLNTVLKMAIPIPEKPEAGSKEFHSELETVPEPPKDPSHMLVNDLKKFIKEHNLSLPKKGSGLKDSFLKKDYVAVVKAAKKLSPATKPFVKKPPPKLSAKPSVKKPHSKLPPKPPAKKLPAKKTSVKKSPVKPKPPAKATEEKSVRGKIYIAGMNLRGEWAPRPSNVTLLNVTSAQGKANKNRRDFSPMATVEGTYKGFSCFENYWQSGKYIEGVDHDVSLAWWLSSVKPHRRYPKSKGKKILHADWGNGPLQYVPSRKEVYAPEYYNLVCDRQMVSHWKEKIANGCHVVVYDFDGPRDSDGNPVCIEVDIPLLIEKINEEKYPFGHGYIVAGMLANIHYDEYVI